jgi:hypothetical protein
LDADELLACPKLKKLPALLVLLVVLFAPPEAALAGCPKLNMPPVAPVPAVLPLTPNIVPAMNNACSAMWPHTWHKRHKPPDANHLKHLIRLLCILTC